MKGINKENIKKYVKMLKNITYSPTNDKAVIFFQIENERDEDIDGLTFCVKDRGVGSKKSLVPGLILVRGDDGTKVELAYATTTAYSPEFDVISYLEFLGEKVNKELRSFLNEHIVFMIQSEYIASTFEL